MDKAGRLNLAPYSFFNAVGETMVAFSSTGRKDAMTFAEEGGEFVCSLATWDLRDGMNDSSAPLPRGESEFAFANLETAPSAKVRPPRVAASPPPSNASGSRPCRSPPSTAARRRTSS